MPSIKLNYLRGLFSSKPSASRKLEDEAKTSNASSDSFRSAEGVEQDDKEEPINVTVKPKGNEKIVRLLGEFSEQPHTWNKIRMAASECSVELKNALSFVSACDQLQVEQNNFSLALKIRAVFVEKDCKCPVELSKATSAALRSGYMGHFSVFADARAEVLNQLSSVPAIEEIVLNM
jgi:hypothetical protein